MNRGDIELTADTYMSSPSKKARLKKSEVRKLKICPRCHRNCLNDEEVMNSISHIGDRISICNECGKQQGLVGMGYSNDIVEIEMEKRFRLEVEG